MGPKLILTEEEKEARKKRRAEQARIRYAAKCGAAREQMLQAIREARWRKKSALNDSQRRAMLQARLEARKKKRAMLDEEGREAMLEAHHKKRATLDEKQREVMLEAKRQTRCYRKSAEQCNHRRESERMAAMTGEQRDDHNRKKREAEQRRVASMTDEQRDEHYKQKREAEQRRVAAMTDQQRDEHYKQKREAVQQRVAALRLQCVSFAAQQTLSPCVLNMCICVACALAPHIHPTLIDSRPLSIAIKPNPDQNFRPRLAPSRSLCKEANRDRESQSIRIGLDRSRKMRRVIPI